MYARRNRREAARLATLEHLGAVRPETDEILQKMVDDMRGIFGTELCLVNLALTDKLYHRAWSGDLPAEQAKTRTIPQYHSTCLDVVEDPAPLVVEDFQTDERFDNHELLTLYGMRFYAGAPLVTSDGVTSGTVCLLDPQPKEFSEAQLTTLEAFARAVVERLELIGALEREQVAKEGESQRRRELQHILDTSPDMIATVGPDGVLKSANPAFKIILGYEPEELVGRSLEDLIHPEDRERTTKTLRALVSGTASTGFENRYLRKNGRIAWIEWNGTPLPEEGEILWIGRDSTERKRAEEKLHLRDRAIAASSNGILITDPNQEDNPIIYVNSSFERITGYTSREAIGRNCRFLAGNDRDQPAFEELRVAVKNGRGWSGVLRNYRKDGALFWNEMSVAPVHDEDGRLANYVGVQNDITERKKAEEAVEKLGRQNELILNSAGEGIIGLDPEGHIEFANPAAAAMLGYEVEELAGKDQHGTIHHSHPDGAPYPVEECPVYAALRDGAVHRATDEVFWRKDGASFPVEYASTPIREGSEVIGAVVTFTDINERKRAQTLVDGQKRVLELIATGASLPEVLEVLARFIEEHSEGALCSVMLLDGNGTNLRFAAGPSLPEDYNRAADGMAIGPSEGSCGTAVYQREAVVVSDIASDPLWAERRERALEHGL